MCKFNEDEIIKYANDIINATFIEATLQDKDGNIIEQGLVNKDVIKGLLDLYQKEKEKNKTLETLLQGNLYQMYRYQANSVSKDKIRAKIKSLEEKIHIVIPNEYNKVEIMNEFKNEGAVDILKELLEEE